MANTETKQSIWGNNYFQSDKIIKPLLIPRKPMDLKELESYLQTNSKRELELKPKTFIQKKKPLLDLTPIFNTTLPINNNNNDNNNNNSNSDGYSILKNQTFDPTVIAIQLKRLPETTLFSNSKSRKVEKEEDKGITLDIKKLKQEYQYALFMKNNVLKDSKLNDDHTNNIHSINNTNNNHIINDHTMNDITNDHINTIDNTINSNINENNIEPMNNDAVAKNNQYDNSNKEKNEKGKEKDNDIVNLNEYHNDSQINKEIYEHTMIDDVLEEILGDTDYNNNNKLLVPTRATMAANTTMTTANINIDHITTTIITTTNIPTSSSLSPRNSFTPGIPDTVDTQPITLNPSQSLQQYIREDEEDEEMIEKCFSVIKNLPSNAVPIFPTKIQMDAIQEDLLDAKSSVPMSHSSIKKHILKCIDILNHPAIPLVKGHEEAVNENWKGSGKTLFLEQLCLKLEKEYDEFHMVVTCHDLTMEEQLLSIYEKRYIVQRISMVMDDEWDYDYGIVAKIRKPVESGRVHRQLLPQNVDLVIMIDPRDQVTNQALKSFKRNSTLTGPPLYLHLVSSNSIEQRLYQYLMENGLQKFQLPNDDDTLNCLTDVSADFALTASGIQLSSKIARNVVKWIKRKNGLDYTFKIKKLRKYLKSNQHQQDQEHDQIEVEVSNVDSNSKNNENNEDEDINKQQQNQEQQGQQHQSVGKSQTGTEKDHHQPEIEKETEEPTEIIIDDEDEDERSTIELKENNIFESEGEIELTQVSLPPDVIVPALQVQNDEVNTINNEREQIQVQDEEIYNNMEESSSNIVSPVSELYNDNSLKIPNHSSHDVIANNNDNYITEMEIDTEKLDLQTELNKLFSNNSINRLKKEIQTLSNLLLRNGSPELNSSDTESFYSATSYTAIESSSHQLHQTMEALYSNNLPTLPKSEVQLKLRELKSKFDNDCIAAMKKITAEYEKIYYGIQKKYLEKGLSDLGLSKENTLE